MSTERYVVAICCSDIHMSLKPPIARSVEPCWLEAMKRQFDELKRLSDQYEAVPILCGGDLFDKWGSPVELVNWAIKNMPTMYAVPGQHDAPEHSLDQLQRSAYWTLVAAGNITNLRPGHPIEVPGRQPLRLWGFPWGVPIKPVRKKYDMFIDVAVVHSYVYNSKTGYPGVPKDKHIRNYREILSRYDAVLFGDNHRTTVYNLERNKDGPALFNPGSFYRRKMDEIEHSPVVGLLYNDGTIVPKYLDDSSDKFLSASDLPSTAVEIGFEGFVEELSALGDAAINFSDAVKRMLEREKVSEPVKKIIRTMLENSRE